MAAPTVAVARTAAAISRPFVPQEVRTAGARGRRLFTYLGVLGAVAVGSAACGGSAPRAATGHTGGGAASPAVQLQAGARAMQSVPSYAFSGTVVVAADRVQISGRFQAPDRLDETVQVPGRSPVHAVLVGSAAYVQDPNSGVWHRANSTGSATDPRAAFGVLLQASGVSRSGDTYRFSVPAETAKGLVPGLVPTGAATGSARLSAGTIVQLAIDVPGRSQSVSISIDYSSIGAASPVTLPPGV